MNVLEDDQRNGFRFGQGDGGKQAEETALEFRMAAPAVSVIWPMLTAASQSMRACTLWCKLGLVSMFLAAIIVVVVTMLVVVRAAVVVFNHTRMVVRLVNVHATSASMMQPTPEKRV